MLAQQEIGHCTAQSASEISAESFRVIVTEFIDVLKVFTTLNKENRRHFKDHEIRIFSEFVVASSAVLSPICVLKTCLY